MIKQHNQIKQQRTREGVDKALKASSSLLINTEQDSIRHYVEKTHTFIPFKFTSQIEAGKGVGEMTD